MAKSFISSYKRIRDKLREDKLLENYRSYTSQNDTCLQALEKYLYSYRWCKNDNEKLLLQTIDSYESMEVIAQKHGIPYSSYRAMSSRVSRRLYDQLGTDFTMVILGDDRKEQDKFIRRCVVRCDDFNFSSLYPDFLVSKLKEIADAQEVEVSEDFTINKDIKVILKFLADYSVAGTLKSIRLMDEKWLAYCYKVLTDPKYMNERAEMLAVIHKISEGTTQLHKTWETAISSIGLGKVVLKKDYDEYLQYKKGARKNENI